VDYWQPGGLYRRVWLRIVPQNFLADVFAKPVNVLDASRRQVIVSAALTRRQFPSATRASLSTSGPETGRSPRPSLR